MNSYTVTVTATLYWVVVCSDCHLFHSVSLNIGRHFIDVKISHCKITARMKFCAPKMFYFCLNGAGAHLLIYSFVAKKCFVTNCTFHDISSVSEFQDFIKSGFLRSAMFIYFKKASGADLSKKSRDVII